MIKALIKKIKSLFSKEEEYNDIHEWLMGYEAGFVEAKNLEKEKKKSNETKQTRSKKQPSKQHQRKEKSGNKQTKK
jgi:FtsZ-interacting cell division protein YlmF